MIVFWAIAAMLLAGALLMLVPPLWRAGAASGGVTSLRPAAWLMMLGLPAASVLTYLKLGDLRPLAAGGPEARNVAAVDHSLGPAQIEARVAALAERLRAAPADAQGWAMLGRSYVVLGRFRDAATAWRRAVELRPDDATLLADLADVLAMAQGKRLAGEPAKFVQRALDADPRHVKALALAGSVAFEARDYPAARGYWERLLAVVPADSDVARSTRVNIAQAGRMDAAVSSVGVTGSPVAVPALNVEISLAPDLLARVAPGDTLFVVARGSDGVRMPVAATRQPVAAWPVRLALTDAMSLQGARRLSAQQQVVVSARISRSGQASPQPGDLVGESGPVPPAAQALSLRIDHVQP